MAQVRARKARDISAVLAAVRRQQGLTQAQLADTIGIGRDYVVDLESGQMGLQVTRLLRLLGELGVEIVLTLPESSASAAGRNS